MVYDNMKLNKNKELKEWSSKVYIILPVYNWEKYFLEQLISIYDQDYENRFLIIVNDGSTDYSEQIAKNFVDNYNLQDKVLIVNKSNWWLNSAINRWFEEIKKLIDVNNSDSLISYCDCDDIRTRNKLAIQVEYMNNNPECDLSYHDLAVMDKNWVIKKKNLLKWVYRNDQDFLTQFTHWYIRAITMVFRAKYVNSVFPLPSWFSVWQDYRTVLVIFLSKWKFSFIKESLGYYRQWHESMQVIQNKTDKITVYEWRINYYDILQKKFPEYDLSHIISYHRDIYVNWYKKWYSIVHKCLLMMLKYPRMFLIFVKIVIYDLLGIF